MRRCGVWLSGTILHAARREIVLPDGMGYTSLCFLKVKTGIAQSGHVVNRLDVVPDSPAGLFRPLP
jgi:hypothetical protein